MALPVLVTGGAGFIGSHVCKALKQEGFSPIAVDNFSRAKKRKKTLFPLIVADIGSQDALREIFSFYKPLAVLHFAAFSQVQESLQNPLLYYENNFCASLHLLKVCLEFQVKRFLFSSSSSVYGIPSSFPIKEDSPIAPISPYGYTKSAIERVLFDFEKAYSFQSIILRYFNAAGADLEGELGEEHDPETHLIPLAIRAAFFQETPLSIFGTDFPTKDGYAIRDFIHVTDLARAHVLGLKYLLEKNLSAIFNVGSGTGFSVKQVCNVVEEVVGKPIPLALFPRKKGDPPELYADITKIRKELSFEPKYSSLREIVQTAYSWEKSLLAPNVR